MNKEDEDINIRIRITKLIKQKEVDLSEHILNMINDDDYDFCHLEKLAIKENYPNLYLILKLKEI